MDRGRRGRPQPCAAVGNAFPPCIPFLDGVYCKVMRTYFAIPAIILFSLVAAIGAETPGRTYSSIKVFQAWTEVENLDHLTPNERLAKHSLVFHDTYPINEASWDGTQSRYGGLITRLDPYTIEKAMKNNAELRKLNPDIKLLVSLNYREGTYVAKKNETENWWENGFFPPDSPYWLKDKRGNPVIGWGEDTNLDGKIDTNDTILTYLVDFRNPEVQDLVAQKALALKESGLFDGVFFDWMNEDATTDDASKPGWYPILAKEEELAARIAILSKVRALCGDDFLIMGNTNYGKRPVLAPLLNAVFMECYKDSFDRPYTREELEAIQDAVIFNQQNLASPALVCLEGWRTGKKYNADKKTRITERNTPENLRMMRFFTAMSLVLTDGYVLFGDDNGIPFWDHAHNWYDFWDTPIGEPISPFQQKYEDTEGLYVREFDNAWVVYNCSGKAQTLGISGKQTTVADMDGEIILKTGGR